MLQKEKGRPTDVADRSETELGVYDCLDRLGIVYDRVDHEAAFTMEACVEIDKALAPGVMCKNLLLCNAQKTDFYLLMLPGEKRFKTKELSRQIGSARLSFAGEEPMWEYLRIRPGSLSVMGLLYDTQNRVELLVDKDLAENEYVGCHPCVNTTSLSMKTADLLETFLPAVHHPYRLVTLMGE